MRISKILEDQRFHHFVHTNVLLLVTTERINTCGNMVLNKLVTSCGWAGSICGQPSERCNVYKVKQPNCFHVCSHDASVSCGLNDGALQEIKTGDGYSRSSAEAFVDAYEGRTLEGAWD